LFIRWPKIIEFYLCIQSYQQSWPHFSWATLYMPTEQIDTSNNSCDVVGLRVELSCDIQQQVTG